MTGESMPVEKFPRQQDNDTRNPLDLDNILFMGTNVVSGTAMAVILTTGNSTYFGALAQRVGATDRAPTSFQTGSTRSAGC
jgi:Mg2+-importing ATPase